jgi:hypothetical protein
MAGCGASAIKADDNSRAPMARRGASAPSSYYTDRDIITAKSILDIIHQPE